MEGNFDHARIARDRYGRPLKDRYGRPIYRRVEGDNHARPNPLRTPAPRRPIPPHSLSPWQVARPRGERQRRSANPERSEHPVRPARSVPSQLQDYPGRAPRRELMNETRIQQIPPSFRQDARPSRPVGNNPRAPRREQAQRVRRPRLRRPRFKVIALALVLLLVGTTALVDVNLQRIEVFEPLQNRPSRSLAANWLLVGSDSRVGLTQEQADELATGSDDVGQRTDTIMIAHVPIVGKPKLVSIPRDSYVDIPGYGQNKINAAFSFGGAPLLVETVEQATGIRIDHYAEIGFSGFAGLVDAVGGIEMCPPEAIDDPLAGLNIQAGCQKFDGKSALGYVRTRATAQGDLDRVGRQREFMSALVGRMSSPAVWLNPFRFFPMLTAGTKAIFVGESDHVWHLAWLMLRMALGTDSLTVPDAGTMDTYDAGNVLLWDEGASAELFKELK